MKPTDLKFNPRVNPPSEATKNSEAAILVQSNIIRKCINDYMSKTVETTSLSPDEAKGKESLTKRVKNGEIIFTFIDKDGCVVICPPSGNQYEDYDDDTDDPEIEHTERKDIRSWDCAKFLDFIHTT